MYYPPQVVPQITTTSEAFLELTFLCFLEKNVTFLDIHYYISFIRIVQKSGFYHLKPHFVSFFLQKQGSTLSFFQILIKVNGLWILIKIWKKPIRVVPLFFEKKMKKTGFQLVKLTFWTILIKHDAVGKIQKSWFLIKSWKKTKGTTLFFVKKMTQNGISSGKIYFLNNSDKTWCSIVNSKFLRFFLKNTKMLIPKTLP